MTFASVNGALIKEDEAAVSINDRSFRYGDGVFETIPVHGGLPYLWEYHEERLGQGLAALSIAPPAQGLLAQAMALCRANALGEGLLRIQVSRGAGSRGYLPSGDDAPVTVMQTQARGEPPGMVMLWLSSFEKISPRALPVRFKLAQGLNATLARMEAREQGCFDALQLAEGGFISEASSANIFWRAGGTLYTPSPACGALWGVTRRRVMELLPRGAEEGCFTLDDLLAADAVILTNAAHGAIAVSVLIPQGKNWNSSNLADEINALRNNDITHHAARLKQSLALT